ncbi:MAG: hypothetical protein ACE5FG_00185 [Myxococcota bacterium]
MKIAGCCAVALAMLLGAGGVTVRSEGDPPSAPTQQAESPQLDESNEAKICPLPPPIERKLTLHLPERPEGDLRFPLNSRGYNYSRP